MRLNVEPLIKSLWLLRCFSWENTPVISQVYLRISKEIATSQTVICQDTKVCNQKSQRFLIKFTQSYATIAFTLAVCRQLPNVYFYFYWVIFRKTFEMIHNWSVTENSINLWAIHISSWLCCTFRDDEDVKYGKYVIHKVPGVKLRLHTLDMASLRTASR